MDFISSCLRCRLCEEPAAYGKLGLANLLEMREECLREFHFMDVYRTIKQRYIWVVVIFLDFMRILFVVMASVLIVDSCPFYLCQRE